MQNYVNLSEKSGLRLLVSACFFSKCTSGNMENHISALFSPKCLHIAKTIISICKIITGELNIFFFKAVLLTFLLSERTARQYTHQHCSQWRLHHRRLRAVITKRNFKVPGEKGEKLENNTSKYAIPTRRVSGEQTRSNKKLSGKNSCSKTQTINSKQKVLWWEIVSCYAACSKLEVPDTLQSSTIQAFLIQEKYMTPKYTVNPTSSPGTEKENLDWSKGFSSVSHTLLRTN